MTLNPYLLHIAIELRAERKPRQRYYSAKLVKRLILSSNQSLERLFHPTRGAKPKLIHITPLYAR